MKLNKMYFQVILEKYGDECDKFEIFTYNSSILACKKYNDLREIYNRLTEGQKEHVCIKLQCIDRSISRELFLSDIIVACGHNVMNNYIFDGEKWERLQTQYLDEECPPLN